MNEDEEWESEKVRKWEKAKIYMKKEKKYASIFNSVLTAEEVCERHSQHKTVQLSEICDVTNSFIQMQAN